MGKARSPSHHDSHRLPSRSPGSQAAQLVTWLSVVAKKQVPLSTNLTSFTFIVLILGVKINIILIFTKDRTGYNKDVK